MEDSNNFTLAVHLTPEQVLSRLKHASMHDVVGDLILYPRFDVEEPFFFSRGYQFTVGKYLTTRSPYFPDLHFPPMLYADIKPNVDGCLIAGDFGSCEFRFALSAIWLILAIALGSALLPEMIQKMQSGTLSITDLPWPLCMLGTLFLVGYLFKYLYLRSERNNAEITIWVTAQFTSEELSTSP